MDDNERIIRIEELKKLREQAIRGMNFDNNQNQTYVDDNNQGNERGKMMVKTNGHVVGFDNSPNNNMINNYYSDKKAGMVNVLMLSIMTFVFECLFLFLSFMIYN